MNPAERVVCASCGRAFAPRARHARTAESVRYCSAGCRAHRPGPVDRALEEAIIARLQSVAAGGTICPSEVARAELGDDWRDSIERVRRAARRLVAAGRIVITQQGRVVDPSTARGPIRLRRSE
jgi:hypothetical protein